MSWPGSAPPPADLGAFVGLLEEFGELRRVDCKVDPRLEIAAVTARAGRLPGGGPALYFARPGEAQIPVLTNLFGSPGRMALALGVNRLDELGRKLAAELAAVPGSTGMERLERVLGQARWQPRPVAAAACRPVPMERFAVTGLPALQAWSGDGGRYLTLPLVFTRPPGGGAQNCGMYRLQVYADGSLGLHLGPRADAARHLQAWHARGEALPVAVVLGGPPALLFAAGLPLPAGAAETALAGLLLDEPLAAVSCQESELRVPGNAEVIIEGEIRPGETRPEGPFGNHTGRYVPARPAPRMRVTAVACREQPLFPATVVGPPPMEDSWLAKAAERLLLPVLQQDVPEVRDWNLPLETIFHGAALVAAKVTRGEGRALLQRLRRHPLLAHSRLLVLFDAEVDVRDLPACYWRAVNLVEPAVDLVAGPHHLDIDATGLAPEDLVGPDEATRRLVERRWQEYGLGQEAGA